MQANTSQGASSPGLEDLDKILESSSTQINDEYQAIKTHRKEIADHQDDLTYKNGGAHAKPSDIIRLDVRGTELFARRDTLTAIKGSRFEALFSGRLENQILRDGKGTIFMDIVPAIFKMILEYLYMVNISEDVPPLPEVVNAKKDIFDTYVDFFKLRSEAGPETRGTRDNILIYHGREGDDGQIDARASSISQSLFRLPDLPVVRIRRKVLLYL